MHIFIRHPFIKSSNRWQRDGIGTATSVDPRGAVPRPIPLVDRSQTDRAHADNLHGDRLPAGNAAANEPMCPDARVT